MINIYIGLRVGHRKSYLRGDARENPSSDAFRVSRRRELRGQLESKSSVTSAAVIS